VGLKKAAGGLAFFLEFSLLLSFFQEKESKTNTSTKLETKQQR
jgi:hypothetical protein